MSRIATFILVLLWCVTFFIVGPYITRSQGDLAVLFGIAWVAVLIVVTARYYLLWKYPRKY